ncbi:MAG: UDP-N-acetylmuramate--L-alanine ligase, partial [Firmicutes bacterium]|nr:UDP-N-acetylmuramate--L-alanine ligase [Bacillota bacterium]
MSNPYIKDYQHKRVHMIGIGGSSMSGLARMLHEKGYTLTGSDNLETYTTKGLRALGIPVVIGHHAQNVQDADMIIYTVAVSADNAERVEAERLNIPAIERAVLLGQLMDDSATAIGVCGTHGKTTTTSMIAQVLMATDTDPSIHIGGNLELIGGNVRTGKGDIFLTEACEFNLSFMHLKPDVAVITNIDEDHLDFFCDIDHIQASFHRFLSLVPQGGTVIGNRDDPRVMSILQTLSCQTLTYGMSDTSDVYASRISYNELGQGSFDLVHHGQVLGCVALKVAGDFN